MPSLKCLPGPNTESFPQDGPRISWADPVPTRSPYPGISESKA
jgi:hypothetical protein